MVQPKKSSKVKVKAFIQARKTSTRLPNKIYEPIAGVPILYHVIDRVAKASLVDDIVVCSPHPLEDIPEGVGEFVYHDEMDVLGRYYHCLLNNPADYVVRITADCPLLDPHLIDFVIHHAIKASADYCSNVLTRTFPDGVDCEVMSKKMLYFLQATVNSAYAREHVTIAAIQNKKIRDQFNFIGVESVKNHSDLKYSVDTPDDLERVRRMF